MNPKRALSIWLWLAALAALLAGGGAAAAEAAKPLLAPLFTDDMVIQRDVAAPVWGWAAPGAKVEVALADAKGGKAGKWEAKADEQGRWEAKIGPVAAGGPYALTVKGKDAKTIKNVLFGDVYLCAGGVNMGMGVGKVDNAKAEIAAADFPKIRLYYIANLAAPRPLDVFGPEQSAQKWQPCSPKALVGFGKNGFSAAAYFFGREMFKQTEVPIGLINPACGFSRTDSLASAEALTAVPALKAQVEEFRKNPEAIASKDDKGDYVTGRNNAMIAPLAPLAIRGVIWYQGENDEYKRDGKQSLLAINQSLLTALVKDWDGRFTKLPDGKLPCGIVMLSSGGKVSDAPVETISTLTIKREAQLRAAKALPNCGIASAVDLGNLNAKGDADVCPRNKQEVGRRLALFMLHATGQKPDLVWSGPVFKEMKVEGDKIRLEFDHVGGGLTAKGGEPLKWFAISGADRKFAKAEAKIDGNAVVVSAAEVSQPVAVRYAWANVPEGANLYNKEGLPALPFRTDKW